MRLCLSVPVPSSIRRSTIHVVSKAKAPYRNFSDLTSCRPRHIHHPSPSLLVPASSNLRFRIHTCVRALSSNRFAAPEPKAKADSMVQSQDIAFSANAEVLSLRTALESLLEESGGRWALTDQRNGLQRSFRFKSFKKTWEFMNAVAAECAVQKHHPEWSNVYNTTFIRWTTHSPPGLSSKDVSMAAFCDAQAAEFGEVIPSSNATLSGASIQGTDSRDIGRDLVDTVAAVGGDCCVPKSKR